MLRLMVLSVIHIIGFECIYFEYSQPFNDQVINEVETVERNFIFAVLQNSEDNVTSQSMKSIHLKMLYFHHGQSAIMVSDAFLSLDTVTVKQMTMDLIHRKVTLEANFNFIQVDGILTLKQTDHKSSKTKFTLMMDQTLCHGIASTKGNISSPHLESLYLLSTDYTNPCFEIKSQGGQGKPFEFLSNKAFGELLLAKLDREITYHLSKVIKIKIDQVLQRSSRLARQEVPEQSTVMIKNYQIDLISNANNLVDNVLKFVADFIQGQFEDRFPLPPLNEKFAMNIIIPITGSFSAKKGVAAGLKTIYRTNDVVLGSGNDSLLHFYGGLGFKNLRVKYNYYKAELMGIGPVGTVDVRLQPLKILLYARVNTSGPAVNLEEFRITNVGGVKVGLTGFGGTLDWLVSMASTWIFGIYRDQILKLVEGRVKQIINQTLLEGNLDDILSG